jgi:2,4-dienoyl-CoA reductase (NADPH2)
MVVSSAASIRDHAYPHLFTPTTIGSRTLQNRVVLLPHGTAMVANGAITQDDIEYFRRRAMHRPGMIVSGAAVVHPSSTRRQRMLVEDYAEHAMQGLAQRAEMIRSFDVVAIGQLIHLGRETIGLGSGPIDVSGAI